MSDVHLSFLIKFSCRNESVDLLSRNVEGKTLEEVLEPLGV